MPITQNPRNLLASSKPSQSRRAGCTLLVGVLFLSCAETNAANWWDEYKIASPEITDPEKQTVWKIAEALADCGGAQYAAHQITQDAGLADIAKASQEAANGSVSASSWVLWSTGIIESGKAAQDFADQRTETRRTQWLARYQSDPDAALEDIKKELQRCADDLGDIKEQLVDQLRRWLYQQPAPVE